MGFLMNFDGCMTDVSKVALWRGAYIGKWPEFGIQHQQER